MNVRRTSRATLLGASAAWHYAAQRASPAMLLVAKRGRMTNPANVANPNLGDRPRLRQ